MSTGPKGEIPSAREGTTPRGGDRTTKHRSDRTPASRERSKLLKAARAAAKKYGQTIGERLMEIAYTGRDKRLQIQAIRIFLDGVMTQDKHIEPPKAGAPAPLILPEERPDPAKVVQLVGAK